MEQETIERVKYSGELIKNEIVPLLNARYCDLTLVECEGLYYVIQTILDNYEEICHYEDGETFKTEKNATERFDEIIKDYKTIKENEN